MSIQEIYKKNIIIKKSPDGNEKRGSFFAVNIKYGKAYNIKSSLNPRCLWGIFDLGQCIMNVSEVCESQQSWTSPGVVLEKSPTQ